MSMSGLAAGLKRELRELVSPMIFFLIAFHLLTVTRALLLREYGVRVSALAGATIWLLVTQPVTVADAVAQGEMSPVVRALGAALYEAFQGLLKYL